MDELQKVRFECLLIASKIEESTGRILQTAEQLEDYVIKASKLEITKD